MAADEMDNQLYAFVQTQISGLSRELTETRADIKQLTSNLTTVQLQFAEFAAHEAIKKLEKLQERVSIFEREAGSVKELKEEVKTLHDAETGRKAQIRLGKVALGVLTALNLLLAVYIAAEKVTR